MASTLPPVSAQISSAVVFSCTSGLAGLSNCAGIMAPGVSAAISSAFAIAPFMPFSRGVSTICAPRYARILRRSIDIESGIVRTNL
jgi:hypothetical protein